MATKAAYYTVAASVVGVLNGKSVIYREGEVVEADDPAVKEWPDHFIPLVVRAAEAPVEQATASPGEKRDVTPPTGKAVSLAGMKGRSG